MDKLRLDQDTARAAALAALEEGLVGTVVRRGAPALVLAADPPRLVHANGAALRLFGAASEDTLALRVVAGLEPAFARLLQLNKSLRPGAPARFERLRASASEEAAINFNIRRIAGRPPLLIAMAPDLAGDGTLDDAAPPAAPTPVAPPPAETAAPAARAPEPPPAASPPQATDDARSAEEVARALAARFGDASVLRFLWQTDGQDQLVSLTGPLCDVTRCRSLPLGRSFPAFVAEAGADGEGRLAAAFAARQTWSNLDLTWPIADSDAAIAVVIGGLPTSDHDGFQGFRGFGVIHLQRVTPHVVEPAAAPEPQAPEPEPGNPEAAPETVSEAPAPETAAPAAVTNVVPLRPMRPVPVPAAPPPKAPAEADPARGPRLPNMVELSASERNAFREIARALGARTEDSDPPAPAAPPRERAPEPPKAPEPPAEPTVIPAHARVRDLIEIATRARGLADDLARDNDLSRTDETPPEEPADQGELALESAADAYAGAPVEPEEPEAEAAAADADPAHRDLADHARELIDRMPIGVLISRLEVPIYLNKTLLDLLGYETADAFHDAGGLDQMFRGRSAESLSDAAGGGAIPIVTQTGEVIAAEVRIQSITWNGDPATMICLRPTREADLLGRLRSTETDLRGRDAEIRELHAILDTATDGVVLLDEDGKLLSINRAAQALFGCEPTEILGTPLASLFARESQQVASDYLAGLRSSGVASVMNDGREVTGLARQGGSIPLFMTIGRVNAGGTSKFCAVLRDLTSWKKAERELNEARKQAERASALKSDFLAKVSHEIRTPLNAILGFAEVIMDERFGPVGNERYKDYLKDIHASGTHVMSLVNDLLDLSKIEAGRLELNFGAVDANKIVAECVSLMQPQAARERVIIRMSLAQRLPNIVADERSLRQIVLNLLSNAVKFNEPGGQVIVSTALTDAGHAVIRIRDTGIGMTEAETQTALEPFRQLATARVSGGTGLGLPLTKALVEANRASFVIKSKKKEGTLIEVAFPPTRVLAE